MTANKAIAARGWAIASGETILLETVYPTRIGALTNWLVTFRNVAVLRDWDDAMIEKAWREKKGETDELIEITIREEFVPWI